MDRKLLLALLLSACAYAERPTRALTILHTNDLHARLLPDTKNRGGFAQYATVIRRETAGCRSCILLNAGDLVQGTPVSTIFHGTPIYRIANKLGITASTLGNHEFDYGWETISQFMKIAKFPTVTANVVDDSGKLLAPRPYLIRKVNGIRIAIIGVVMDDLVSAYLPPGVAGPWHTTPIIQTVQRYVDEIGDKADLFVVLGHISPEERMDVLRRIPKVAVVVTGHRHVGMPKPDTVDGRIGVEAVAYGMELGRLDLQVDVPRHTVSSWTWKKIPVDAGTVKAAPDVKKLVDKWEAKVSKIVDVPIGESRREFAGMDLKRLMERAMADEMHADFSYMNLGGVRDRLPRGKLLARHVWNIMPFDNKMVTGKFKGSQLPAELTGGRQVDAGRVYTVAMSDFSAGNPKERKDLGIEGLEFQPSSVVLRDLLIAWIEKKAILE